MVLYSKQKKSQNKNQQKISIKTISKSKPKGKYNDANLFWEVNKAFKLLPLSAVIDNQYFCCHGGLSPKFGNKNIEACDVNDISALQRDQLLRHVEGLMTDLLWSYPHDSNSDYWQLNPRGAGWLFSEGVTKLFLQRHAFRALIRSCRFDVEGANFQHGGKVVSLSSNPVERFEIFGFLKFQFSLYFWASFLLRGWKSTLGAVIKISGDCDFSVFRFRQTKQKNFGERDLKLFSK